MTETMYGFLLSLTVFCSIILLKLNRKPWQMYALMGIVCGLTFLTRPEFLLFIPFFSILIGVPVIQGKQTMRNALTGLLLFALTFSLTLTPWMHYNWRTHGELSPLPNKRWGNWESNWLRYQREVNPTWRADCPFSSDLKCAIPGFENLTEIERDKYTAQLATAFFKDHPTKALYYAVTRVNVSYPILPRELITSVNQPNTDSSRNLQHTDPFELYDYPGYRDDLEFVRIWLFRVIVIFAVASVILAIRMRQWSALLLATLIGVNVLTAFLTQGRERYRMSIDPYLIILTCFFALSVVRSRFGNRW